MTRSKAPRATNTCRQAASQVPPTHSEDLATQLLLTPKTPSEFGRVWRIYPQGPLPVPGRHVHATDWGGCTGVAASAKRAGRGWWLPSPHSTASTLARARAPRPLTRIGRDARDTRTCMRGLIGRSLTQQCHGPRAWRPVQEGPSTPRRGAAGPHNAHAFTHKNGNACKGKRRQKERRAGLRCPGLRFRLCPAKQERPGAPCRPVWLPCRAMPPPPSSTLLLLLLLTTAKVSLYRTGRRHACVRARDRPQPTAVAAAGSPPLSLAPPPVATRNTQAWDCILAQVSECLHMGQVASPRLLPVALCALLAPPPCASALLPAASARAAA